MWVVKVVLRLDVLKNVGNTVVTLQVTDNANYRLQEAGSLAHLSQTCRGIILTRPAGND
jgi:hypothetical protein